VLRHTECVGARAAVEDVSASAVVVVVVADCALLTISLFSRATAVVTAVVLSLFDLGGWTTAERLYRRLGALEFKTFRDSLPLLDLLLLVHQHQHQHQLQTLPALLPLLMESEPRPHCSPAVR
jgi:hypothetical protein